MSASTNQLRVEQRRALDKPTRALASLSRFDYADRFILTTTTHATPQDWALAMFGSVPDRIERLIWVGVLRFPLRQDPGADVIAGRSVGHRPGVLSAADGQHVAAHAHQTAGTCRRAAGVSCDSVPVPRPYGARGLVGDCTDSPRTGTGPVARRRPAVAQLSSFASLGSRCLAGRRTGVCLD